MKILMIGPDFRVVGGMTSLNKMIMEEEFEDYSVDFLASMHDSNLAGRVSLWAKNLFLAPINRLINKPDIVHIHVSTGFSIWRKTSIGNLWNLLGVPIIYHTHGSKIKDFVEGSSSIVKKIIARRFRRAAMIVTLSDGWREWYTETMRLDIGKVCVIPTPIKLPARSEITHGGDFFYSGLMGHRKGTFELIRAWAKIPINLRMGCTLHMIGNGEVSKAKKLVNQLQISDSCIIHGWVSEEEKISLIRESGVYILPSHNEGLPMGLLEAMAWGLVPISSNVGAIPETITDGLNGFLIEAGKIDQISSSIIQIMENSHQLGEMSKKARATAEKYDWSKYLLSLTKTWDEVVN